MKKILLLTCVLCCVCGAEAQAATGDVADHIYSTDIRAFINGVEVESYAIDGKTVVVVEDVTRDYSYNDQLRTLLIGGFAPYRLNEGSAEHSDAPGRIMGDVYETDIKTYIYDTELTSYALNGKTAVALEDLGADQAWSQSGGKYKWDPSARKISLDTLYSSNKTSELLWDKAANVRLSANEDLSEADAEFYFEKMSVGGNINFENEPESGVSRLIPVMTEINGEKKQLGWYHSHNVLYFDISGYDMGNGEIRHGGDVTGGLPIYKLESDFSSFYSFYDEILAEGAATVVYEELTPIDNVIKTWLITHNCIMLEQFDADRYTFAYMSAATPHGSSGVLLLVQPDGTYHNYGDDFESVSFWGTKWFDNVRIDRENEKVYFRYDTDYVIDLKTGKLEIAE